MRDGDIKKANALDILKRLEDNVMQDREPSKEDLRDAFNLARIFFGCLIDIAEGVKKP